MTDDHHVPLDPEVKRLLLDCIEAGIVLRLRDDGQLAVRAPREADAAPFVERIRARSDDLRRFLRADAEAERRLALGPVRHPDNDPVLSSGQERLWFLFQYEEDPTTYNMFGAYRVVGDFSYPALDAALQAIMFRHQVFRSYVDSYDGELVGKFAPVSRVHIPVDDLSDLPADEREAAVADWLEREAATEFDLATHPLWRFRLVKVADDEHVFAFSVHHILCDGVSELILLAELDHWYGAFDADPSTEVPEPVVRYCDYAAWQKTYLGSLRYLRDLAWWRTTLAGAPTMLEIVPDEPRPPIATNHGGWVSFRLEAPVAEGLWQIGRDQGTTTFMVGLTLFAVVLSHYSGQDDVVVGTPVSNRNHPDLEELVGFFVSSVPLRLELDPEASFADAVAAVSARALASFDRQNLPFDNLVDELGVRREPSHNPVFQVMFAMEDAPGDDGDDADEVSGLRLEGLDVDDATTMFDLDLLLTGHDAGHIEGGFNYNADLYHRATIERMCQRLAHLAELVGRHPELTLAELRSTAVDDDLTIGLGPTVTYDTDTTLDAAIAARMAAQPDDVAVEHGDHTATYRQLDQWADETAAALGRLGLGPGQLVAIEIPRGIPFLVVALAAHRRGAAYVPIDPDYPGDRRRYMVTDSGAAVIATLDGGDGTGSDDRRTTVTVGTQEVTLAARPGENQRLDPPLDGESPIAYMIYTSGSTGRPKGALVRHDGALNHIHAEVDALGLADDFVFLQTAPSSSDISVWQFLGPLVYGGRTVVVDTAVQLDPARLLDLLASSEATIAELVPSVVQLLCEHVAALDPDQRALPRLRAMLITGEAAPVPVVNAWLELYPDVPMVNAYGPTEAADDVCQAVITEPLDPSVRSVPIGRPIANLAVHVLDPEANPVPRGAAGEICVAGIGVGAGYHGLAERTAQSFVANPHATGSHDRILYRTGDLGRWRSDGHLEFLGRVDTQVKVRGFRLELGEITACVVNHEAVREAATVLKPSDVGEPWLVAYYSTVPGHDASPEEIRAHLKTLLPTQIVPNRCIHLDELPHLPNGKIDQGALPDPDPEPAVAVDARELGPTGTAVHAIWCDLLGVPALGLDADFFDWGGHSLLAVRMLARVREQFNKEVSIADFFATPRLGPFCDLLDETAESVDTVELVARHKTSYPLSPGQARLWFLNLFESDTTTYNMPGALHFRGRLDVDAFNQALTELVRRHPSLRTRIDVANGEPFQELLEPAPVEVPVRDLSGADPETIEAEVAGRIEAVHGIEFDLAVAPLWHFELIRISDDEFHLLTVVHHIITDGLSNELLIAELVVLYGEYLEGRPSPLPEPTLNYGDYAEWQLELQRTGRHRRQQLYWERTLTGAPALLDLPTDRPRPTTQTYNGDDISIELDPDVVQRMRTVAVELGVTPFMLLTAATAVVLRAHAGVDEMVLGTPIGGRPRSELEDVVGFFVNTIVLRLAIEPAEGFDDLVREVRRVAVDAFDHRDVPFEQIVERTCAERNPSFSPIFQVMVAYEEDTGDGDDLAGIEVEAVELRDRTAMFDLDILFDDDGGGDMTCVAVYNTDLFDGATIERLLGHLQRVVATVVDQPMVVVDAIDVMGDVELDELRTLERGADPDWSHDATVTGLVAASIAERPDAVAVVDATRSLTYAELDAEAEALARTLAVHGAGPGSFVTVVADRSAAFVVAVCAVIRTGAAYVPVDPTYPSDRVRHMLTDSDARLVVAGRAHLGAVTASLPGSGDRVIVVLDEATGDVPEPVVVPDGVTVVDPAMVEATAAGTAPVDVRPDPADPCYMIYTSGSTGRPKGAVISHRAQLNHIRAEARLLDLGHDLVLAQTAPASSDISVWQVLGPLVVGGTTVVVDTETMLRPERFLDLLAARRVTLIELVPAVYDNLLDHLDGLDPGQRAAAVERMTTLRVAMITGEAAPAATIDAWLAAVPGVPLVNAYGPTEAADDVCQAVLDRPLGPGARSVPIGRPIPGIDLYLLDEHGRRVPRGARGEICVAGIGVGDGYWRRPEATAEAFVTNPHQRGDHDAVLYRTGDRGRWATDGQLEYAGRIDNQVNLVGLRIELGEIEQALMAQPSIREAAVVVTGDRPQRLVAFCVPQTGELDRDGLTEALRATLPTHMLPAAFVELTTLPRSPVGKVDRHRLPTEAAEATFAAREYVPPSTDDEVALTSIMAEVLDAEQVSVTSDFFELGGTSLLAVQAVRRIELHFGVELPLVEFFRRSAVSDLLATVHQLQVDRDQADESLDEVAL